ncbi:hypothetical protein [Burkholderia sp. Ac-20353]|uniref:hypothetical protein n=1 Tax=Burkholderia sp. Ac-20353 TaxID=2703894 RepID=UPI001F120A87|nr:hypothetical protein [Burkholderia sp. Ac-20353]
MKKQIQIATLLASMFCCGALAFAVRAHAETGPAVEVAFSPNGGAERLVLRTIDSSDAPFV